MAGQVSADWFNPSPERSPVPKLAHGTGTKLGAGHRFSAAPRTKNKKKRIVLAPAYSR